MELNFTMHACVHGMGFFFDNTLDNLDNSQHLVSKGVQVNTCLPSLSLILVKASVKLVSTSFLYLFLHVSLKSSG